MDAAERQPGSPPTPPPILPYAMPAHPAPAGHSPASPALTPEHLAQLAAARKLGAGLRRAVLVGKVDAWTTGIFGVLTLVCSFGSIPGTLLGVGMAVLGVLQVRATDRLKQLDDTAPAALARNQVLLGILLFAYGAFSLVLFLRDPAPLASSVGAVDPDVAQMLAPYEDLVRTLFLAVYATVMVVAVLGPGLTAMYYYAQRKRILTYRTSTPDWILALQNAGVMI